MYFYLGKGRDGKYYYLVYYVDSGVIHLCRSYVRNRREKVRTFSIKEFNNVKEFKQTFLNILEKPDKEIEKGLVNIWKEITEYLRKKMERIEKILSNVLDHLEFVKDVLNFVNKYLNHVSDYVAKIIRNVYSDRVRNWMLREYGKVVEKIDKLMSILFEKYEFDRRIATPIDLIDEALVDVGKTIMYLKHLFSTYNILNT